MDYWLKQLLQEEFLVKTLKPPQESLYMMPSIEAEVRESSFGNLIVQEIRKEEFCIALRIFQLEDYYNINISVENPSTSLIYVLQGQASYSLTGINNVLVEEGSYYLCYFPVGEHTLQLKSKIFMIVQLELYPNLLNKLAGTYFGMYEAFNRSINNWPNGMILKGNWMNPRICDTLSKLIYCQLEEEIGGLYQEARVRDLLLLYCEDVTDIDKKAQSNFNFTSADIKAIMAARDQQIRKIDETILLNDIARNVNLHPKKLQAGFKKVFGKSPSGLIAEARIEKAKSLLKETEKSVKDIAFEVGFSNSSAFISAFKRAVGVTPLQYRK